MPVLRLFAQAREAAGTASLHLGGTTVDEVVDAACDRFGASFAAVLGSSRIWVNGEPATMADRLTEDDEVAVLPPVSGG